MNKNQANTKIEFQLFSPDAEAVELCLFTQNFELKNIVSMNKDFSGNWHVSEEKQNSIYAYRLHGEWNPRAGKWFNPNKFMFDPLARQVGRAPIWDEKLFPFKNKNLEISIDSNISCAALSAYSDDDFDWGNDRALNIPWKDTVIYEAHLKGLTKNHPEVEAQVRGTYLGLASEAIILHLKNIGVTSIELLPIQAFFSEFSLFKNGLKNFFGIFQILLSTISSRNIFQYSV